LLVKHEIYEHYKNPKYLSIKHSSYFQVYEELLSKYRNKPIIFVEVGVLNGGSLLMWRSYFGSEARIIGVDYNPAAKKWEKEGFEIYIGSQSDPAFWDNFFEAFGEIDVLFDNGGHTNEQQIITTYKCIPHIRDKGILIVEDTHSSYMRGFGNPSRYSFMNYAKNLIDSGINSRFPAVKLPKTPLRNVIYSMTVYETIVCFNIDREKCFVSSPTYNGGISSNAEDFVYQDRLTKSLCKVIFLPFGIKLSARSFFRFFENFFINIRMKKYFD
jgi:hypothetical protein